MIQTRRSPRVAVFTLTITLAYLNGAETYAGKPEPGPLPYAHSPIVHQERLGRDTEPMGPPLGGVATSPPAIVSVGEFVSVQVNVDSNGNNILGDAANEPSIAVDPTNTARMVIGWREFSSVQSDFRTSGYAYTQDGGQSWTFPGVLEPGEFSSDPVLEADAEGRIYYYALQPNRGPGEWACYMYRSEDGGLTWPQEVYARGGDKQWFTIDKTGGPGHGNIYAAWNANASCCGTGVFNRSLDGGLTFSIPIAIPENPWFGTLTVAPDGKLFVSGGTNDDRVIVVRSSNAHDPLNEPQWDLVQEVDLGGETVRGGGPNPAGLLGQVWIDSDHSTTLTQGNIYVLASVDPPGGDPMDVMFIRSEDGGQTWSDPVRVNDDDPSDDNWQWFGTMAVAPNGRIDVVWNDTRNALFGFTSELFYASSLDGGRTWSTNQAVSPPFDPHVGWPIQQKIGDYYDMESDTFGTHIAYSATFNDEQDVYYLRIGGFDCNNNGFPDEDDLAQGRSQDCDNNAVPDECDADCNDNGLVDVCEVRDGVTPDCNGNEVPDQCDPDLDGDDVPNDCDDDIDGDGILNELDACDFTPPGTPIQPDGRAKGDFRGEACVVDLIDADFLVDRCYNAFIGVGGPGVPLGSLCTAPYDFDGDFDIDLIDAAGFQRVFGR